MGDEKDLPEHGATTCSRFTCKVPELLHVAEMRDRHMHLLLILMRFSALRMMVVVDAEYTVIGDRSAERGHGRMT